MAKYSITAPDGRAYDIEGPDGASDNDVINAVIAQYPDSVKPDPLGQATAGAPAPDALTKQLSQEQAVPQEAPNANEYVEGPQGYSPSDAYAQAVKHGGGYGIDPEARDALGTVGKLIDYGVVPFQALQYGTEAAAHGLDAAARAALGKDTNILPGSGLMALAEAFPAAGMETGIAHPNLGRVPEGPEPRAYSAAEQNQIRSMVSDPSVSMDQINQFTDQLGGPRIDEASVAANRRALSQGAKEVGEVQQNLPLKGGGMREPAGPPVEQPQLDLQPPKPAQGELPLEGGAAREPAVEAPAGPSELANKTVDHVNKTTEDWANAPETEVHNSFEDTDFDDNALGAYDADTGKVHLNADAIAKEADHRGISHEDMTNAVLYHEGLGHYGLAQQFKDGLDHTLNSWYDNSKYFKNKVDQWLEDNPGAYPDEENPIARASEEVLAEMSENGRLPTSLVDRLKNHVKDFGRQMGLNLQYSEREIKTILGTTHDAVINDTGGVEVTGRGMRYKQGEANKPAYTEDDLAWHNLLAEKRMEADQLKQARNNILEGKREQVRQEIRNLRYKQASDTVDERRNSRTLDKVMNFHNQNAELGKTTFTQPYESMPDKWSFSYTDPKTGKPVTGSYNLDGDTVKDFSIGMSKGAANDIGPSAVRQIARDIRQEHPGVTKLEAERISGARQASGKGKEPMAVSMARYMKSTYGESKGALQSSDVINQMRSNRNVEDIFKESNVEKTPETWGEWTSDAARVRMTTAAAQKLASGSEVPELLAAKMHALKMANTIHDLSMKARDGTLSPTDRAKLAQTVHGFDQVNQSIMDVVSNAAKILNSSKIEIGTDSALSQKVLRNMLSKMTEAEREALATPEGAKAFSKKLVQGTKNAERLEKGVNIMGNLMNFTRTLWSSMDLSAPFRQGRALAHTSEFWRGIPAMAKYWGSKPFFEATMKGITERPTYERMQKAGVDFTDIGDDLSKHEEQFMSNWASKLPGVAGSERAYNGYLNKLRADTFDRMSRELEKGGIDLDKDTKTLKDLGRFINTATGRGDLGRFNQAAPILSGILFSPRLMAARVNMLNPWYYAKLSAPIRKQAIRSLIAFGATSVIATKLLQTAFNAKTEWDPRSSDFMKLRVGNTRYDFGGGFNQYLTLGARIATNQTKDAKGDVITLGQKYGARDLEKVAADFVRAKLSPNAALAVDARMGKDMMGQPFDPKDRAIKSFIPLFVQDAMDVMKDQGVAKGAVMATPGLFGAGMQTYPGPTGTDEYGRSYETERQDTPAIAEVKRLGGIKSPQKSIRIDGKSQKIPDELYQRYSELSGKHFTESMEQLYNVPQFKNAPDDLKKEVINELSAESKKMAREELFAEQPDEDKEGATGE